MLNEANAGWIRFFDDSLRKRRATDAARRRGGFSQHGRSVRRQLAAYKQRADIPLWITEIGWQAPRRSRVMG